MKGLTNACLALLLLACALPLEGRSKKHTDIIAWDLHDVLLKRTGTLATIWNYQDLSDILKNCPLALIKGICMLFWYNLFTDMSSQYYVKLAYHHANPCLADLVIKITNSQQLMPGMLDIVKELHVLGYEQQILSNIGITAFQALTDHAQYPQFKELFSYINLKKSHVVGNDGIHKPDPQYYLAYLSKNHINFEKRRVIFIDDKLVNINAAHELGFTAIHFKNPEQLRRSLQKLSIPIPRLAYEKPTVLNPIPCPLTVKQSVPHQIRMYPHTKTIDFFQ